jgi:hypothetical protein
VREECLDRVILLNQNYLRRVLSELVRYYNQHRPRRSLDLQPAEGSAVCSEQGKVIRRQVLGGRISDYYRKAA